MSKKVFVLCTLYLFLHGLLPQFSAAQTGELKFRNLTTDDGLPANTTIKVLKDSHGMIWVTTASGLCRYDGYDFKIYQYNPLDTNSLTHNNLNGPIIEDSDGNLWIGTLWGLNKFDRFTETFTRYTHDPDYPGSISSDYIRSLFQDRNGLIWIGTGLKGELNKYDPSTNSFSSYSIIRRDTSDFYVIFSIYEDKENILWVGTSHGLFQFDRENESVIPIVPIQPLPENFVPVYRKILEDDKGDLWFITDWAIMVYEKSKGESAALRPMWGGERQTTECSLQSMFIEPVGRDQILWIAGCGLIRLNPISRDYKLFRFDPDDPGSLAGNDIREIYKDDDDIIWVTSSECLSILDKQQSQIIHHNDFYENYQSDATVLLEDSKNNYWIGTYGKGVLLFDKKMNLIHQYKVSESNKNDTEHEGSVRSLLEDSDQNIWVGTSSGLYLLDQQKNKFSACELTGALKGSKTTPYAINAVFEDSDGIIWAGTQTGIYRNNRNSQQLTTFTNVLIEGYQMTRPVRDIHEDSYGYLWIGVDAIGLYCQPPELRGTEEFIHFKHEAEDSSSLSNSNIMSLYEDFKGHLWIGTRYGLNRFNRDSQSFERIIFESNHAANFIYDINGDNHNNFWLTTQDGLLRLKPGSDNSLEEKSLTLKKFISFKDFRPGKLQRFKNGTFFIGAKVRSENGYFTFHPDSMGKNTKIPPVVITDFQIKNKSVKLDSNILFKSRIVLDYNENFFSFKFASLDYTEPEQNQYAYFLEGLEDDWINSGTRREAYYTGVPPGKYTFRAKGSNNDGYWNEEGVSLGIVILPPPWKTWWAYILYGLLFGLMAYGLRVYDLKRQHLKQRLEIEQVEAEKLKELDSLKSRFFANISHEFRTPLTLILGPVEKLLTKASDNETKQDLNIMQRNALRLQRLITQLLNLSKLEAGKLELLTKEEEMVSLVRGYVNSFESLAKQNKIDLQFMPEEEKIMAWVDRDKIGQILFNLVSNAFKFTMEGGGIGVSVFRSTGQQVLKSTGIQHIDLPTRRPEETGEYLGIKISDTGTGIPQNRLPQIFDRFYQADDSYTKNQEGTGIGLALTKELVELHHGRIEVESEEGVGSVFRVYLPLGRDHLSSEEIDGSLQFTVNSLQKESNDRTSQVPYPISHIPYQAIDNDRAPCPLNRAPESNEPLILIVEDNVDLRVYIRGYLDQTYTIIEAKDGEQGFERAIEHIPDLILSDVMMPKMDGNELCSKLKTDERTSHIPVILLTARASMESRLEGLETGADDFITKPFDPQELLVRINNLIVQRRRLKERFIKLALESNFSQLLQLPESGISSTDQKFLQKAVLVVEKYMADEDFNIEIFQKEMSMSRMQLHRKLKAITNQSATGFIRTLRLKRAADLLSKKTGSVSEIAFEVGFSSLSYFAKSFKEVYGVLPSEYTGKV